MKTFPLVAKSFLASFLSLGLAHAMPIQDINILHAKKVMLVVAMPSEAMPLIQTFKLHEVNNAFPGLPMKAYEGKYRNLDVFLVLNGDDPTYQVANVGTQASTLSTYMGIQKDHPDLVISIGTAGGIAQNGSALLDIYASTRVNFFDRRIAVQPFTAYGVGAYPSVNLAPFDAKVGLKPGVVCSGDSFDNNQTDYNVMLKQHCGAVEMEAAGVAWVCSLTHTPMFAMKGITNFSSVPEGGEQFAKNFPAVTKKLATTLKAFFDEISPLARRPQATAIKLRLGKEKPAR
jgi:5'-methylthioadenosine nucleosidase